MTQIVDAYSRWLSTGNVPNLFVNADPSAILTGAQRDFCHVRPNRHESRSRATITSRRTRPPGLSGWSLTGWARWGKELAGRDGKALAHR